MSSEIQSTVQLNRHAKSIHQESMAWLRSSTPVRPEQASPDLNGMGLGRRTLYVAEPRQSYSLTDPGTGKLVPIKRIRRLGKNLAVETSSGDRLEIENFFKAGSEDSGTRHSHTNSEFVFATGLSPSPVGTIQSDTGIGIHPGEADTLSLWSADEASNVLSTVQPAIPSPILDELIEPAITTTAPMMQGPVPANREGVATGLSLPFALAGGLSAALLSKHGGTEEAPTTRITGQLNLGPIVNATYLKLTVYDSSGNAIGTGRINAAGQFVDESGSPGITLAKAYSGAIMVEVSDLQDGLGNDDVMDYLDEATRRPADLTINLRTAGVIPENQYAIHLQINPLTELALQQLGLPPGNHLLPGTLATQTLSGQSAKTLGSIGFAGFDVFADDVQLVINAEGESVNGNVYGQALALLSGLELVSGMNTSRVLDTLSNQHANPSQDVKLNLVSAAFSAGVADPAKLAAQIRATLLPDDPGQPTTRTLADLWEVIHQMADGLATTATPSPLKSPTVSEWVQVFGLTDIDTTEKANLLNSVIDEAVITGVGSIEALRQLAGTVRTLFAIKDGTAGINLLNALALEAMGLGAAQNWTPAALATFGQRLASLQDGHESDAAIDSLGNLQLLADVTPPMLVDVQVKGNQLQLAFNSTSDLNTEFTALPSSFLVHISDGVTDYFITPTSVHVDASKSLVTLTLPNSVVQGDRITLDYNITVDNVSVTNRAVQDLIGNDFPAMSSRGVINKTPSVPPELDTTPSLSLEPVNEDATLSANVIGGSTLVSTLVGLTSLNGAKVSNVVDMDHFPQTGIAIVKTNLQGGNLFYSLDGGAHWLAVGEVSDSQARLLAADDQTRIFFQPAANYHGQVSDVISFKAWDQSEGKSGDMGDTSGNAYSAATGTVSVDVTSVNDAPTADDGHITVDEDTDYFFTTGQFGFADAADQPPDELQSLIVVHTTLSGELSLNGVAVHDGQIIQASDIDHLKYRSQANAFGSNYSHLDFRLRDTGGTDHGGDDTSILHSLTINVSGVNDAPVLMIPDVITLSDTVAEDSFPILKGRLSGSDLENDSLSYGISSGIQGFFSIAGETYDTTQAGLYGKLYVQSGTGDYAFVPDNSAINGVSLQKSDQFFVTVSDGKLMDSQALTVDIQGTNDSPENVMPSNFSTFEDVATPVPGLGILDADSTEATVVLSVDNGILNIGIVDGGVTSSHVTGNGTRQVTLSDSIDKINSTFRNASGVSYLSKLNYNGQDTMTLVTTTDANVSQTRGSFTFNISPVNDSPGLRSDVATDLTWTRGEAQALDLRDYFIDSEDGINLTYVFTTLNLPSNVNFDGSYQFTGTPDAVGDNFNFVVSAIDNEGLSSAQITFNIHVLGSQSL